MSRPQAGDLPSIQDLLDHPPDDLRGPVASLQHPSTCQPSQHNHPVASLPQHHSTYQPIQHNHPVASLPQHHSTYQPIQHNHPVASLPQHHSSSQTKKLKHKLANEQSQTKKLKHTLANKQSRDIGDARVKAIQILCSSVNQCVLGKKDQQQHDLKDGGTKNQILMGCIKCLFGVAVHLSLEAKNVLQDIKNLADQVEKETETAKNKYWESDIRAQELKNIAEELAQQ